MGSKGLMRDSYIGGIGNASFIPDSTGYHPNQLVTTEEEPAIGNDVVNRQPVSAAWDTFEKPKAGNQTDEDKIISLTCSDDVKTTNINKTEEYNVGYVGLSILPWEDFVFNPRSLNELFYLETNNRITYDPDEVNTFFHGKNVMPPSVGDISENGKSWNIVVDNIADLKKVRTWLTEKCSVFGVTLLYKEKRFQKPERAPCLVMMDPNKGTIGDKLYTTLTRAMDSLHNSRRFCVEINLNACVERWCKRVLMTDCEVVGGKLVITNGEEYLAMDGIEDKVCCVVCFPIWALQTGIYKLHRSVVYDDFKTTFDADDLFLHGTFQDSRFQRRQIFTDAHDQSVFRTRSAPQTDMKTLHDLGSFKFVCVKRYEKPNEDETIDKSISKVAEHNTTTFGDLVQKRKERVLTKEKKMNEKRKDKSDESNYDSDIDGKNKGMMNEHKSDKEIAPNEPKSTTKNYFSVAEAGNHKAGESEDEYDASPRIPEVASVLCDNDEDSYKEINQSDNKDDTESLFRPGAHHNLISKESAIGAKASFNNNVSFGDRLESATNDVCLFNNNTLDDSESETSDSDSEDSVEESKDVGKDDLLNEMLQIEKTLPSLRKDSVHTAKDVSELKVKEVNSNSKKKKTRDKPGVKKALKDLMKTTKGTKDTLPSAKDDRYHEASSKIKQEQQKISNITDSPKPIVHDRRSAKNDSPASVRSGRISHSKLVEPLKPLFKPEEENNNLRNDTVDVVSYMKDENNDDGSAVPKKQTNDIFAVNVKRSPPDGANAIVPTVTNAFAVSSDDSSTDGDDVEMIYESSRDPPSRKSASLFLQGENDFGVIERVNIIKNVDDNDADEMLLFTTDSLTNKTDGEKSTRLSAKPLTRQNKTPDRNVMFQKTNKSSARQKLQPQKSENVDKPTITKSLDIDMEMTDFDQEGDVSNETVVKSMEAMNPNSDLSLKLNIGQGKRQKRGVNRYNSNRKYLGASVPPKQAKGK